VSSAAGGELYREYRHDAVATAQIRQYYAFIYETYRRHAAAAHLSHVTAVAMALDAEARLSSSAHWFVQSLTN